MCGITGFIDTSRQTTGDELRTRVTRMADTLRHRGPDDSGIWIDAETGVALGHRRLSIIDLSPEGHQPMLSSCGRYVIVFNGEIYNFRQIRKMLDDAIGDIKWHGHSDTEIMLEAIRYWGLEKSLKVFNGMFAFALWDRKDRVLSLARDRFGEKPLYYGWAGKTFLFGSELKSLRAHPDFRREVDRDSLALYLRHNYIPAPYSIYKNIYKLMPSSVALLRIAEQPELKTMQYWSFRQTAEHGISNPFRGSEQDAVIQLEGLLSEAVRIRMEADVPLGALLSGGIDSSLIVSLMQAQSTRRIKTFSIGFHKKTHNEANFAKAVAEHLNTEHTELYITSEHAMSIIPRLPAIYDEPFADSSQVPTFFVAELARTSVTVSLSGDGGDELFGGYNRYVTARSLLQRMGQVPTSLRKAGSGLLALVPPSAWDSLFKTFYPVLPERLKLLNPGEKIYKLAHVLSLDHTEDMYTFLVSHFRNPASVVLNAGEPPTPLTDPAQWPVLTDATQKMMYFDTMMYLPGDILTKVDRASMAVSLETRIPILDHRVAEFAWQLPLSMKLQGTKGKVILRKLLSKYVPEKLIERPKMGFALPFGTWLTTDLRDWAEALLDEKRLQREGYFIPRDIRRLWQEHLTEKHNWQYHLWDILMFQAWLDEERRD